MERQLRERPALLIIDMVKDNFVEERSLPITPLARKTIDPLNRLIRFFRKGGWPIVFSTDAFHNEDFIFTGRMNPHSLAGTEGAEVIDELEMGEQDLWLPKPRFSAFFGTELDRWLREKEVTLCAMGGISTNFCVLSTLLDAICNGFKSVLQEDCSAASSETIHEQTLDLYRTNPLHPLLRIANSIQLMDELTQDPRAYTRQKSVKLPSAQPRGMAE